MQWAGDKNSDFAETNTLTSLFNQAFLLTEKKERQLSDALF